MSTDNFIRQINASQNKVHSFAFCLTMIMVVCLTIYFAGSGTGKFEQKSEIRIEDRVNPNYAPRASLVRLPGIGNRRAEAIENFSRENNNRAFGNCDDLQKVKGIGVKTAANICKWLKFE